MTVIPYVIEPEDDKVWEVNVEPEDSINMLDAIMNISKSPRENRTVFLRDRVIVSCIMRFMINYTRYINLQKQYMITSIVQHKFISHNLARKHRLLSSLIFVNQSSDYFILNPIVKEAEEKLFPKRQPNK
jgi:hypothetical protein